MRRRQNGKRDREGESYSHCTFEAARLDISAADADLRETRTQKNTTPNSPIQTHRFAHSQLVCSLFPLYRSPVTGRIWTRVNSSISCTSRAHTHTQRQTSLMLSILIHRTIKKKSAHSYQGHRQPRQRHFALNRCTKPHVHSHSCTQKLSSICSPTL